MSRALALRGPDGEGEWRGEGCALVHRRLAIIDPNGSPQPMSDTSGRVVITYNGETYNYRELRERLKGKGHAFSTAGDTEVLLEAYKQDGDAFVEMLDGMFAFGLWDVDRRRLLLARDRVGIKPLYYWHSPATGELLFASDLRALLVNSVIRREIDGGALAEYLHFGYAVAPRSWIRGVRQLEPGQRLVWQDGRVELKTWYRWSYDPRENFSSRPNGAEELRETLASSVASNLVSDVPVGSFLSGGIDSSAVTGLARIVRSSDGGSIRAFTVRFWESAYDESVRARAIARDLGCEYEEVDAARLAFDRPSIDRVVSGLGEPFGDNSALAVFGLCESARSFGKVALAGDGGDELFLGYGGMAKQRLARRLTAVPAVLRRAMLGVLGVRQATLPRRLRKYLQLSLEEGPGLLIEWHRRWAPEELNRLLPEDRLQDLRNQSDGFAGIVAQIGDGALGGLLEQQIRFHMRVDLPADCLFKVDRMSMAHGFEVRPPILSNEMLEYGSHLPLECRTRNGRNKEPLRTLAESLSPTVRQPSPKRGFEFPLDGWMREGLGPKWREWDLSQTLGSLGFRTEAVNRLVAEYEGHGIERTFRSRRLAGRLYDLLVLAVWSQNTGARI